ncbi:hypothetical protein IAR55_004610 [Kwoniella newhampshirensis]|uniref:Actin interacting protein 3 C-terminal domain-containing protein n=1 Tax=Kwoniella newhampshirensis TaxID=1651941 RepID=A0AAW0YXG1_9TREE
MQHQDGPGPLHSSSTLPARHSPFLPPSSRTARPSPYPQQRSSIASSAQPFPPPHSQYTPSPSPSMPQHGAESFDSQIPHHTFPHPTPSHAPLRHIPAMGSMRRVDHYQPLPGPKSSESHPRSAEEVFKAAKSQKPPGTASEKIMMALTELGAQLGNQIIALQTDTTSLKNENRCLRDQVHELQLGQRTLATKDEIIEEVAPQLTTSITDTFQPFSDQLDKRLGVLPRAVAELSVAELKDVLKFKPVPTQKEEVKHDCQLLVTLQNHLLSKLEAFEEVGSALNTIKSVPHCLCHIEVWNQAWGSLHQVARKVASHPDPSDHTSQDSLTSVNQSLEEVHAMIDKTSPQPDPSSSVPLSDKQPGDVQAGNNTTNKQNANHMIIKDSEILKTIVVGIDDIKTRLQDLKSRLESASKQSGGLVTPGAGSFQSLTDQYPPDTYQTQPKTPATQLDEHGTYAQVPTPLHTGGYRSKAKPANARDGPSANASSPPVRNADVFGPHDHISQPDRTSRKITEDKSSLSTASTASSRTGSMKKPTNPRPLNKKAKLIPSPDDRPQTRSMSIAMSSPTLPQALSGCSKDEPIVVSSESSGSHTGSSVEIASDRVAADGASQSQQTGDTRNLPFCSDSANHSTPISTPLAAAIAHRIAKASPPVGSGAPAIRSKAGASLRSFALSCHQSSQPHVSAFGPSDKQNSTQERNRSVQGNGSEGMGKRNIDEVDGESEEDEFASPPDYELGFESQVAQ